MPVLRSQLFRLPTSHKFVNKYVVKDFMEWLVEQDICSEEEFRNLL